jgi:hypothetical protein
MRRDVSVLIENRNVPFFFALFLFAMGISAASRIEAADLFLNDEPEVYAAIDRLSALGYLPLLPANTRPYSVHALRAATKPDPRAAAPPGFDGELFRWLAAYVAPKEMGRVTGAAAFSDSRFTPANGEGVPVPKGWSGRASVAIREQTTPLVNGQLRFTSFYGEGGDDGNRLLDASIELGSPWLAVQAGKISTWYGPGRHGALIFTNNAAPYPGVRVHNLEPIPAPGPFSFLGALQYDVFAARMEKKERFSHSLLVGTRLAARPSRWFEIGFSRAMHYDGEGRSKGIGEFFTDFFGNDGPPDSSNSLYGFDLTLTLPFPSYPVQAYWERAGQDRSQVGRIFLPWSDRWANLYGLYFPRIFRFSRLDLRVEYADNESGEAGDDNWYAHPAYPHRYHGEILGHPMGGNAKDWFVESRYHLRPDSYAGISYERVLRDGPDAGGERRSIVSAGLVARLSESWRGEARASWDRVTDEGGITGRDGTDVSAWVALSWQTNVLVPSDEQEVPIREYPRANQ